MKIFFTFLLLLVGGCVHVPQYVLKTNTLIDGGSGKSINIVTPDTGVDATKLRMFWEQRLKESGFKIVSPNKKSDYSMAFGINRSSWQSMKTVPIMGKTGIRSINTNSFGNITGSSSGLYNGTTNYGYGYARHQGQYNGNYNANYWGTSQTTVDYETGVVGYQNVVVDNFFIVFAMSIVDNKMDDVVFETVFSGNTPVSNSLFVQSLENVYSQIPLFVDVGMRIRCIVEKGVSVCNPL